MWKNRRPIFPIRLIGLIGLIRLIRLICLIRLIRLICLIRLIFADLASAFLLPPGGDYRGRKKSYRIAEREEGGGQEPGARGQGPGARGQGPGDARSPI